MQTDSSYHIDMASTDGVALLTHPRFGRQVWVRSKLRKSCQCAVTGRPLHAGDSAYRPLTNQYNRMQRICEQVIKDSFPCHK